MNQLYTSGRVRIQKDIVTHIKKYLLSGQIMVSEGDEILPQDIIGHTQTQAGFRTVHLAKELGVTPGRALAHLKRAIGKPIYRGELLALKEGLFSFRKKILLSPVDGIVDFYDPEKGELKIKLISRTSRVISGVFGVIDKVDKVTGTVLVKTMASKVYGVVGSGKEREGFINVLGLSDVLVSSKQIMQNYQGQIIVGGALVFLDALQRSVEIDAAGIVTGGMSAQTYKTMVGGNWNIVQKKWSDVGVSVIVTEGFGSVPMGDDIFNYLRNFDQKFGIIDGNRARLILPSQDSNSMIYVRKTQLPASSYTEFESVIDVVAIKVGTQARVVSDPYFGVQGKIISIDNVPTRLPSGIVTFVVTLETSRSKIRVPYPNLEVIG